RTRPPNHPRLPPDIDTVLRLSWGNLHATGQIPLRPAPVDGTPVGRNAPLLRGTDCRTLERGGCLIHRRARETPFSARAWQYGSARKAALDHPLRWRGGGTYIPSWDALRRKAPDRAPCRGPRR